MRFLKPAVITGAAVLLLSSCASENEVLSPEGTEQMINDHHAEAENADITCESGLSVDTSSESVTPGEPAECTVDGQQASVTITALGEDEETAEIDISGSIQEVDLTEIPTDVG